MKCKNCKHPNLKKVFKIGKQPISSVFHNKPKYNLKNYSLDLGANVFEDLTKLQSDRYQFVFPYYNYSQNNKSTNFGTYNFASKGNNILDELDMT